MFDRYNIRAEGLGEINIDIDDNGDWVKYEDVKHLLERSDNSGYKKSCFDCDHVFSCEDALKNIRCHKFCCTKI